ncbi:TPA: factor H binding protein domain-containing protein [Mannheimia haemolytica]
MSIKKVTLASLILLGLTACSSGGSGGSSNNVAKPNTKPQTTQQQTDKAAAEKAAKDKAAKEKAEADRLAAEKAAKEKAEAERLAAEKAAKEKAEAERLAAEKAAKEKAEAERLAVEKAAKEKAEAERLAAEKISKAKGIDIEENGFSSVPQSSSKEGDIDVQHWGNLYNQKYSVVVVTTTTKMGWDNDVYVNSDVSTVDIRGLKTDVLPKEGKATYTGQAFDYRFYRSGDLSYDVDFSQRIGSGKIRNSLGDSYTLSQGNIDNGSISGTASKHQGNPNYYNSGNYGPGGNYKVQFFGPNAEEIGGELNIGDEKLGLSGTRGDIQK